MQLDPKTQQVRTLLAITNDLNNRLAEEGLLHGISGITSILSFQLDDKTFAVLAEVSEKKVELIYQSSCVHYKIKKGYVEFAACHNLV